MLSRSFRRCRILQNPCLIRRNSILQPQSKSFRENDLERQGVEKEFVKSRAPKLDVAELLKEPTWSVESLVPTNEELAAMNEVTPEQLRHLLRLSALPPPKDAAEEKDMIETLHTQLHFVRKIQEVDTTGVEPLVAIRDETSAAKKEATIGLKDPAIMEALSKEEFKGKNQRPRRKRDVEVDTKGAEDWDVLGTASMTVGRYFVVNERDKDKKGSPPEICTIES